MGFFSKLARQMIGKSDEEIAKVLMGQRGPSGNSLPPMTRNLDTQYQQNVVVPSVAGSDGAAAVPLPSPRPIVTGLTEPVTPPPVTSPVLPPRINVNVGEPPPVPEPRFITDMEQVRATLPQPSFKEGRVVYNDRNPAIPPPRAMTVDPTAAPAIAPDGPAVVPAPSPSVFVGVPTRADMTASQKAGAKLEALQTAGSQSKVTETPEGFAIEPPHKIGRLKAMGKGFLLRMLAGSSNGVGGMLGAGLAGTVEGAVAPGHVQSSLRQNEIYRAQGDQQTAQQLERGELANQAAKVGLEVDQTQLKNLPEDRQRRMDAENNQRLQAEVNDWQQQVAQLDKVAADDPGRAGYIAALQTEAERLSAKAGRKITLIPGEGRDALRMAVDGQIIERNQDGSWKSVFGSPKLDRSDENYDEKEHYDWQVKNTENAAKRAAAQQSAAAAESVAADHQKKVSDIAGRISALDNQMGQMSSRDPQLGPLKRQREQLKQEQAREQTAMDGAYKERDKAKADIAGIPVVPPPPRRARRSSAGLTIEGAIQRFKTTKKRAPTDQEVANMQAALQN